MKNQLRLPILLCAVMLSAGCAGMQEQKTAVIELEGNPTTGYTWVYTMSPRGIISEISNEYIPDSSGEKLVGAGGKFVFTFEAISKGTAEIFFSYLRIWEEGKAPIRTAVYKATVDERKNLILTQE